MNEFYPTGLTGSQESNDFRIHERHFCHVQNKPEPIVLELLFQFPKVLRLKVTNQTNRGGTALRNLFDLQFPLAPIRNFTLALSNWFAIANL